MGEQLGSSQKVEKPHMEDNGVISASGGTGGLGSAQLRSLMYTLPTARVPHVPRQRTPVLLLPAQVGATATARRQRPRIDDANSEAHLYAKEDRSI